VGAQAPSAVAPRTNAGTSIRIRTAGYRPGGARM